MRDHEGYKIFLDKLDNWKSNLEGKMVAAASEADLTHCARVFALLVRVRGLLTNELDRIDAFEERMLMAVPESRWDGTYVGSERK